jgi:hypothetical protein
MDKRYGWVEWGPHGERKRTSEANWKQADRMGKAAQGRRPRPRVFCASLADWLDNQAPQQWRMTWRLIERRRTLTGLLLTKRPENFEPPCAVDRRGARSMSGSASPARIRRTMTAAGRS